MTSDAADADKAMIAELRTAYNRAIQTRDLDRIESFLLPAYVVLPGSVGTPKSRDETRAIFAKAFADPAFVEYVRETRVVVVSSGRRRSACGMACGRRPRPNACRASIRRCGCRSGEAGACSTRVS